MLTEETGYKLDVLPDGRMKVHRMTYVIKDGVKVAEVYGEYMDYEPGQFDPAEEVSKAAVMVSASKAAETEYDALENIKDKQFKEKVAGILKIK